MKVAKNIKTLMQQRGISAAKLARKLQTSERNIIRWANGETEPTVRNLGKLARALDVTTDFLIFGNSKKK